MVNAVTLEKLNKFGMDMYWVNIGLIKILKLKTLDKVSSKIFHFVCLLI